MPHPSEPPHADLSPEASSRSAPPTRGYTLLQQQLIALQTQRDRRIGQLTRLNRLSDSLLGDLKGRSVAEVFAEAIVDVLDIGIGAVWLLGDDLPDGFAVCGSAAMDVLWASAGPVLAERLAALSHREAIRLPSDLQACLPGIDLADVLVCRCIDGDERPVAIVMAANSHTLAGMVDPIGEESVEVLSLLAEKLAALLERENSRRRIAQQVEQQRRSEQRLMAVLNGTNDGWWDLDLSSGECFLSPRWLEMMASAASQQPFVGRFWRERIHPADRERFDWLYARAMADGSETIEAEVRMQRDDGADLPVLIRGSVIHDDNGVPVRFSGLMQDLTERHQQEDHIRRLAFYDVLTDLPNRRLLQDRIEHLRRRSNRDGSSFALMLLDLDRFKSLNDTRGHAAGDQLLCRVAARVSDCLRPDDMVARLGGDEFVALIQDLGCELESAQQKALVVASKIRAAVDSPLPIDQAVVHQTVSIGVALHDAPDVSGEILLQRADVALYNAKENGRNRIAFFRPDMQQRMDRRVLLETRLREACEAQAFELAYQLQVDRSGQPVAAEALLRLNDANGQAILPSEFIPVAEDAGLMVRLGDFVLDRVCHDMHTWIKPLPPGFRLAINLGTSEFMDDNFVPRIIDKLNEMAISGDRLLFEITEDVVLSDLELASHRMNQLRDLDVQFSLDDFGTGNSSFNFLRYLPVSELKVDRSFVRRFLYDQQDRAIVESILSLARSLELRVVAEGVETHLQHQELLAMGCSFFQGYLFDRPMTERQNPLPTRLASVAPLS